MAAAATATLLCVAVHALAPFDVQPTQTHVTRAIERLSVTAEVWPWQAGLGSSYSPGKAEAVSKLASAGSYGLLAFFLVLSAHEANGRRGWSSWYALTRSASLAVSIEALQLFTISHIADMRDLILAWMWCGGGTALAMLLAWRWPEVHRRPAVVLRGVVALVVVVMLGWAVAAVVLADNETASTSSSWLPSISNFNRSWNGLLGDYTAGFLRYTLVAGLLVLWCRSTGRFPRALYVLLTTVAMAVVAGVVFMFYRQYPFDTAQILVALAASIIVVRLDRSLWGRRKAHASAGA